MSWSDTRTFLVIIGLVMLFKGEPDLFDNLHVLLMDKTSKECVK